MVFASYDVLGDGSGHISESPFLALEEIWEFAYEPTNVRGRHNKFYALHVRRHRERS
jgi:hypothetical protein